LNALEYEDLLLESCEHLRQGRYRMALKSAQSAYEKNPDDDRIIRCYAFAKLENNLPAEALDLAETAVNNSEFDPESRFCRGYILYRMHLFDNALSDLNFLISKYTHYDALLIKARIMSSLQRCKDAEQAINTAIKINETAEAVYIQGLIKLSNGYNQKVFTKSSSRKDILLSTAREAFRKKEYWFSLWAAGEIIKDRKYKKLLKDAVLLELETLLNIFRFKEAFDLASKDETGL
jgi:tetratricopeptide (TPR) repeat protein